MTEEKNSVWWVERDYEWIECSPDMTEADREIHRKRGSIYHFCPQPPCEEGKHEWQRVVGTSQSSCTVCHSHTESKTAYHASLDVGASVKCKLCENKSDQGKFVGDLCVPCYNKNNTAVQTDMSKGESLQMRPVTRSQVRIKEPVAPPPIHQDPRRWRGHLKGCHAWRYENYDRCSCHVAMTATTISKGCGLKDLIETRKGWIEPLTDRLSAWDL